MADDTFVDMYCHIFPDRFFQEMKRVGPEARQHRGAAAQRAEIVRSRRALPRDGRVRRLPPGHFLAESADRGFHHGGRAWRSPASATTPWPSCARSIPSASPPLSPRCRCTDVEGSVEEARRAINDLAPAAFRFSPVAGKPLDDPSFEPIFAAMAQLDLPIWLHPARTAAMTDYTAEQNPASRCGGASAGLTKPRSPWSASCSADFRPLSQTQDRHPPSRRHDPVLRRPHRARHGGARQPHLGRGLFQILPSLKRPHLDYLRDFYADTAMFGGGFTRCAAGWISSAPTRSSSRPTRRSARSPRPLRRSRSSNFRPERRKLFFGNTEELLKTTLR